ncbi:MAG: GNAT family N-acetyltransferase [Symbiobacteriaceae bacterium]|nr:MAG: streptothricin acetyltransferase [Bacillota bacterium]
MWEIRPARWPQDRARLASLDTGFVTDRIYRVVTADLGFLLREERVDPPLRKTYDPLTGEDLERLPFTLVVEDDNAVVGFAAAGDIEWNGRVHLWHLYVAPERRGLGIGRALVEQALAHARRLGARALYVETQNVNYPAIQFYRRLGFTLAGLDTSLYDPHGPGAGEVALYLVRDV